MHVGAVVWDPPGLGGFPEEVSRALWLGLPKKLPVVEGQGSQGKFLLRPHPENQGEVTLPPCGHSGATPRHGSC